MHVYIERKREIQRKKERETTPWHYHSDHHCFSKGISFYICVRVYDVYLYTSIYIYVYLYILTEYLYAYIYICLLTPLPTQPIFVTNFPYSHKSTYLSIHPSMYLFIYLSSIYSPTHLPACLFIYVHMFEYICIYIRTHIFISKAEVLVATSRSSYAPLAAGLGGSS